jgi:pSer/pThr/pTyr-binding forkhead associated (FHA) protein
MTKILLKFKDAVIKEILLVKEVYTIGRKEENDIVINNLATSGHHAKFVKEGEKMYIEDTESTNGTFVNGKRIAKCPLNNSDVILIGNHTLEFITDVKPAADQTKFGIRARSMDETILLSPTDQQKVLVSTEKLEVVGGFIVIEGTTDKKEYELKERVSTIGKDDSAVIKLKGLFAPKVAALINRRKDGYFITPSGGKDLKINGSKIEQRYDLKDGDIVEIAGLKMQFYLKE